jgi:hypothetical protein
VSVKNVPSLSAICIRLDFFRLNCELITSSDLYISYPEISLSALELDLTHFIIIVPSDPAKASTLSGEEIVFSFIKAPSVV